MVLLLSIPFACRKADFSKGDKTAAFDVAAAKEWWYGSFRKSADFKRVNFSSPIIQMLNAGNDLTTVNGPNTANNGSNASMGLQSRLPSWRRATHKTIGDLQIVEAPLIGGAMLAPIAEPTATKAEEVKLAALTQHKLLISTNNGGGPSVRVVTLVPSLRYAKAKNWDLGVLDATALPADFEGDIIACNWAGTLLNAWRKERGRPKVRLVPRQRASIEKSDATNATTKSNQSAMVCEQVYMMVGYHYYCIAVAQVDEPPDAACERDPSLWRQGIPIWEWVTVCLPGGSDGGPGDDICPPGLSMEECFCALYNVGCEGGGGDGEVPSDCNSSCFFTQEMLDQYYREKAFETDYSIVSTEVVPDPDALGTPDQGAATIVREIADQNWTFFRFHIPAFGRLRYTADYSAIRQRKRLNNVFVGPWTYESFSYAGWRRTDRVILPMCTEMQEQVNSGSVLIFSDRTKAAVRIHFSFRLKANCMGVTLESPRDGSEEGSSDWTFFAEFR